MACRKISTPSSVKVPVKGVSPVWAFRVPTRNSVLDGGVPFVGCVSVGVHDVVESLRDFVELPGVDLLGLVDEELFDLVGGVLVDGAGPSGECFGDDGDVCLTDVAGVEGGADDG